MRTPRYMTGADRWYKGNTHIHSTASDGGLDFSQLAAAYAGVGYDFLCRTDHWVASRCADDTRDYPLLWLDGIELDGWDGGARDVGSYYHIVALGAFEGISREMGFMAALAAARAQGGLTVLAHPCWTGNSFEDALRWGLDGVEIYNHVCHWLNGKDDGLAYWQAMLEQPNGALAWAVDDAHLRPEHPGWNGGWVMVQAAACTPEAIFDALREGRYYSSTGPAFHALDVRGPEVSVTMSPVRFVRLVGPASRGARIGSFDGSLFAEASFVIPDDWAYAYLEIEDAAGKRAWTNTLLVDREDGAHETEEV